MSFLFEVFNPAEVGAEGKGYTWRASNLDDTDDEELSQCLWGRIANLFFMKMFPRCRRPHQNSVVVFRP